MGRAEDLFHQFVASGEITIDKFIAEQICEELFIDYKRLASDGDDAKLHHIDRENFGRAVAGFGNSEGGIIVWGVDCRQDPDRGDVPSSKHPIRQVKRFLSHLEGATSGCTLPPHDGVRHYAIERPGARDGFVITYVPKSMFVPHQCIVGKFKGRYYIRVGSNFELASHGLLSGMFGRQPSPHILAIWGCGGKMAPSSYGPIVPRFAEALALRNLPTSVPYAWNKPIIRNGGVTVAKDLYVNLALSVPGPRCVAHCPQMDQRWEFHVSIEVWHFISSPSFRLAPGGMVAPFGFCIYLKPPFVSPLCYDISFGCDGSPVNRVTESIPPEAIESGYGAFLQSDHGKQAGLELACRVFNLHHRERDETVEL